MWCLQDNCKVQKIAKAKKFTMQQYILEQNSKAYRSLKLRAKLKFTVQLTLRQEFDKRSNQS